MPLIYDTGLVALLPFRKKSYSGFLCSEKNPSTLAGFEPVNLGFSGEYDNHRTTGVDFLYTVYYVGLQYRLEYYIMMHVM